MVYDMDTINRERLSMDIECSISLPDAGNVFKSNQLLANKVHQFSKYVESSLSKLENVISLWTNFEEHTEVYKFSLLMLSLAFQELSSWIDGAITKKDMILQNNQELHEKISALEVI